MDLVNEEGCSTESLLNSHTFTLLTGLSYSDTDYNTLAKTDTLTTSISLDYTYKNFSFGISTSYYENNSETFSATGFNDTFITTEYKLVDDVFYISLGVGLILPTYESLYATNEIDYMANVHLGYTVENVNLFALYGYTLVNDTDTTQKVYYQNIHYASVGIGYFFDSKFYANTSYNISQSVYKDIEDIESLSLYGYYSLSDSLFVTANYMYGLSESASDTFVLVSLGYKF